MYLYIIYLYLMYLYLIHLRITRFFLPLFSFLMILRSSSSESRRLSVAFEKVPTTISVGWEQMPSRWRRMFTTARSSSLRNLSISLFAEAAGVRSSIFSRKYSASSSPMHWTFSFSALLFFWSDRMYFMRE